MDDKERQPLHAEMLDIDTLTEAQMGEMLEKGFSDIAAGRTRDAKDVFADLRKEYGI